MVPSVATDKIPSDATGNRSRDHPTSSAVIKGNSSTKRSAYTTLVRPILEYGAARWDPYREGQIHALDRAQKKAAKFAHRTNELNWETVTA